MARIQRSQKYDTMEFLSLFVMLLGIVVVGVVLMVILRVQRGLIGLILGGAAVVLLAYWLREVRRLIRTERPRLPAKPAGWSYDLIEQGEEYVIVAEVPGPSDQVNVELIGQKLDVKGGNGFQKEILLPEVAEVVKMTYNNGVLNLRLRKR